MSDTKLLTDEKKESADEPSWLSRLLFCSAVPLVWRGWREDLNQKTIPKCRSKESTKKLGDILSSLWEKEQKKPNPSLKKALIKMFGFTYLKSFFLIFFQQCVLRTSMPVLIGKQMNILSGAGTAESTFAVPASFVLVSFLGIIINHQARWNLDVCAMRIRIALTNIVYQKTLRLSQAALSRTGAGQLSNIISNDTSRFDNCFSSTPAILTCPLQLLIVGALLWVQTGPACLAGIFVYILMIPVQALIGSYVGRQRARIAGKTDARSRLLQEILNGILLVKMCNWEEPYRAKIKEARRSELQQIRKRATTSAFNLSLYEVVPKASLLATFATLALTDSPVTPESVFVTLSMYNVISAATGVLFPIAVVGYAEMQVAVDRIQRILLLKMSNKATEAPSVKAQPPINLKNCSVKLKNLSASWVPSANGCLFSVSLEVKSGELLGITGPVGSGKSTVLQAILGELITNPGGLTVVGSMAYVPQEPCLFPGTLQENILFGLPLDTPWYLAVLEACALTQDVASFPYGNYTHIGDKGINLSGGQKARVGMARAVYSRRDIYLLDDPLSAVDSKVAHDLMNACFRVLLREKCVILVTHQTRFLKDAIEILVMNGGSVVTRGSYSDIYGSQDTEKYPELPKTIDDIFAETNAEVTISETNSRLVSQGQLQTRGYGTFSKRKELEEVKAIGQISCNCYWKYFRAGNSILNLGFLILLIIAAQGIQSGSDFWLKKWTDSIALSHDTEILMFNIGIGPHDLTSVFVGVYAIMLAGTFVLSVARSLLTIMAFISSAAALHTRLFDAVLRAPMRFFEVNSVGRIVNRFLYDIGVLDETLPARFFVFSMHLAQVFGSLAEMIIAQPILSLPALFVVIMLCLLFRVYLGASSQFRRLEIISRSPLFVQMLTTLSGLTVVRCFGAQELFHRKFYEYQDVHTANFFTDTAASRWYKLTGDLIVNLLTCFSFLSFIIFPVQAGGPTATAFGLTLSAALALSADTQRCLGRATKFGSTMVSVERVLEYCNLTPEGASQTKKSVQAMNSRWLNNGAIRLNNVSVGYEEGVNVLTNVTVNIRPGEKIGIVGRTGAGKSSFISTLFRVIEPTCGSIHISNVDISGISLKSLRSQLAIISQNPLLIAGSLRENLDPFNHFTDKALWAALATVGLQERIQHGSKDDLEFAISESGANLSHGERQLICLARIILRNTKILVLDEATANIDKKADAAIQETLRQRFKSSTVLTVAHRLETVMECDRILVIDQGRVQEFDEPSVLLRRDGGYLFRLAQHVGERNAQKLRNAADEARNRRISAAVAEEY